MCCQFCGLPGERYCEACYECRRLLPSFLLSEYGLAYTAYHLAKRLEEMMPRPPAERAAYWQGYCAAAHSYPHCPYVDEALRAAWAFGYDAGRILLMGAGTEEREP